MIQDPIVEEIRRVRRDFESTFQNDPQKYYEHFVEFQKQYEGRLASFQPKPALKLSKAV